MVHASAAVGCHFMKCHALTAWEQWRGMVSQRGSRRGGWEHDRYCRGTTMPRPACSPGSNRRVTMNYSLHRRRATKQTPPT
jgi:hypothetical protein